MLESRHCGLCCRSGEIGRRKGLKIPRAQKAHAGSIPASGTKINELRDGRDSLDGLKTVLLPHCCPISRVDQAGQGLCGGLLLFVGVLNVVALKYLQGFVP